MEMSLKRPQKTSWRAAVSEAQRGDTGALAVLVGAGAAELSDAERRRLFGAALGVAEAQADYGLLIAVLEQADVNELRADALAAVLGVADELAPRFAELMGVLRDGERALILGALIEVSRLDPLPERRLLRLKRLVRVIPQDSRSLYWREAEALAEQGGDDAQLALLGFVRELPLLARPLTLYTLRRAVKKVRNAFKRALAFISLSELTKLSRDDLREAEVSAELIPDETLRIMTFTRLSQLGDRE